MGTESFIFRDMRVWCYPDRLIADIGRFLRIVAVDLRDGDIVVMDDGSLAVFGLILLVLTLSCGPAIEPPNLPYHVKSYYKPISMGEVRIAMQSAIDAAHPINVNGRQAKLTSTPMQQ